MKNTIKFIFLSLIIIFSVSCAASPPPIEDDLPEIVLPPSAVIAGREDSRILPELPIPVYIFPPESVTPEIAMEVPPVEEPQLPEELPTEPPAEELPPAEEPPPAEDLLAELTEPPAEEIPAEPLQEEFPPAATAAPAAPPTELVPIQPLPAQPLPAAEPPIVEPLPAAELPVTEPLPAEQPPAVLPLAQAPPEPPAFIAPAEPLPAPLPPPPPAPDPFPLLPARTIPEPLEQEITFSRVIRAAVGQIVEIPFRGTGWVYLGEIANRRGLRYESRRLDVLDGLTEGQSFIFICEEPGTYILRFYRQDFIQDYMLNDYVQVIVGDAYGSIQLQPGGERSRVIAEPRWPLALGGEAVQPVITEPIVPGAVTAVPVPEQAVPVIPPPAAVTIPEAVTFPEQAVISAAETLPPIATEPAFPILPEPAPPEPLITAEPVLSLTEYVERARQEFNAGRVEQALVILDTLRQHYPNGSDEAWFLYAQLLEANSPSRDIRLSLEFYRRLINEYPMSSRVQEAQRQIAYLERFYFNIR